MVTFDTHLTHIYRENTSIIIRLNEFNLFKLKSVHSFQRHEGKRVFLIINYIDIIRLDERVLCERLRELDGWECVVGRECGIWQGMGLCRWIREHLKLCMRSTEHVKDCVQIHLHNTLR